MGKTTRAVSGATSVRVGVDLAKRAIEVHAVDAVGKREHKARAQRGRLRERPGTRAQTMSDSSD